VPLHEDEDRVRGDRRGDAVRGGRVGAADDARLEVVV
jgi:hypothetical protein